MMSDGVPDVTWTKREPPSKPTAEAVITGNGGAIDLTDMGLYPEVSVTDRVWRLARPDVIGERSCRLFACWAARRVLELEFGARPDPKLLAAYFLPPPCALGPPRAYGFLSMAPM